jgi:hypothetical protein
LTPAFLAIRTDGGQGVGVVGGELGVEVRRGLDQGLGADQVDRSVAGLVVKTG